MFVEGAPFSSAELTKLQNDLHGLGIVLDTASGHLFYDAMNPRPSYAFELVLVRHGETYGNCGQVTAHGEINDEWVASDIKDKSKRIYQGNVDAAINQLTHHGQQQALQAAHNLESQLLLKNWQPDVIFYSPLSRARDTGIPFIERNKLTSRFLLHDGITEMAFGAWNNRRICDMSPDHPCHSFYRQQNALVQQSGVNGNGIYQQAECFAQVVLRAHHVLERLARDYHGAKIIFFSHSMFAAACSILFDKGQILEQNHLGFDGQSKDGRSLCLPHAQAIFLSKK